MEIFGIKITVGGVVATVAAVTTLVCGVNLVKASINKKLLNNMSRIGEHNDNIT